VPLIPRLEWGGVLDKPTFALIAEAGRELALPLTKPWEHQRDLLEQAGVMDRLAADHSFMNRAMTAVAPAGPVTSVGHMGDVHEHVTVTVTAPPAQYGGGMLADVIAQRAVRKLRRAR
jgi:hypothetical protein